MKSFIRNNFVIVFGVFVLVIVMIGSIAASGSNSNSSSANKIEATPTAVPVDTEDPTPGTEGRLTVEEEEIMNDELDKTIERAAYYANPYANIALYEQGIASRLDVEDIKLRDAEATRDGFPVEQEGLPAWRKQSSESQATANEGTLVEPDEAAEVAAEDEICPPGSDYRC